MHTKLLGVIDEDPFSPFTWSGSSTYLFNALRQDGSLYRAISAMPSPERVFLTKLLSFQFGLDKWRFKYHLNANYFRQMTNTAINQLEQTDDASYNTILQIGAWYDLTGYKDKISTSYHDGNLAMRLQSPYGYPRISASIIENALAYERNLYHRMDLIFPMSDWLATSFIKDFSVDPSKIHVVGAGINLPKLAMPSESRGDTKKILFVGKDFARKGGRLLVDAFMRVRKHIRNAELVLVGPSIKNLPDGIRCEGYVSKSDSAGIDRLLSLYSEANLFVLPSLYEPFGIALAEAMAHRLPCIGTRNCAIPEIIDHGITGLLAEVNDERSLADAISTILEDENLAIRMGDAGYKKYEENYRWEVVSRKIRDVIQSRLDGR